MEENVFLSYISVGTLTHEFPDKTDIFLPTCSSQMLSTGVFRTQSNICGGAFLQKWLKVHSRRFENLTKCFNSYKSTILKISHS